MKIYLNKSEVGVFGTVQEFQSIAQKLCSFVSSIESTLQFRSTRDADSTNIQLEAVEFVKREGPIDVTVEVSRKHLLIQGSAENLKIFAQHFEFDPHAMPGEHQHPDYVDKADYMLPSAIPIVIEVR